MTDLKTVIENAIEANLKYGDLLPAYDQDAVATAIRDHFLDREKVRAALGDALDDLDVHCRSGQFEPLVDRLIEGLSK